MRYKWTLLAMLWGIVFFNYADRQALAAVIPLLREAWHLTPVQEGMLGSAFAWTYGLSSPFAHGPCGLLQAREALDGQLPRTLPRVDDGSGDSRPVGRPCRAADRA